MSSNKLLSTSERQRLLDNSFCNRPVVKRLVKCGEIISAYLVFYVFVIGFFNAVYWTYEIGFSETHSQHTSVFLQGKPGMQHFPIPKEEESIAIWYSKSNLKSIRKFTKQLVDIVNQEHKHHKEKGIDYVTCEPFQTAYEETQELPSKRFGLQRNQACRNYEKNLDWGPCTPFGRNFGPNDVGPFNLSRDAFGYASGQPCFIIRLNRVLNWIPSKSSPTKRTIGKYRSEVRTIIRNYEESIGRLPNSSQLVWLLCDGKTKEDQELMGTLEYYPNSYPGIPKKAFPFKNEKGYLPPFIFLRFVNPTVSVLLKIECYAYDNNIEINEHDDSGLTSFELLIDD